MNDRELLELAAKICGAEINFTDSGLPWFWCEGLEHPWNPLTDDGDALRLAAKLELEIQVYHGYGEVWADNLEGTVRGIEEFTHDRAADYRRAIVRAAAEIGKSMP